MAFGVGKLDDFVLDRRTIPRTARRDRPTIHRRAADVLLDYSLALGAEERDPTRDLFRVPRVIARMTWRGPKVRPREVEEFDLAVLPLELREIDRPPVDARR